MNVNQDFVDNIAECALDGRLDVEKAQHQLLQVINDTIFEANRNPDWRLAKITAIYVSGGRVRVEGDAVYMGMRKVESGR